MTASFFLSNISYLLKDPAVYLACCVFVSLAHLLIWSVARHTSDVRLWRTLAFCLPVGFSVFLAMLGTGWLIIGASLGYLSAWLILGRLFELKTSQRFVLTAIGPPSAVVAIAAGIWLRDVIMATIR